MNAVTLTSIIVFWLLAVPALVGDVLAARSDRARRVGRICTGLVMLVGGAAVNAGDKRVGPSRPAKCRAHSARLDARSRPASQPM